MSDTFYCQIILFCGSLEMSLGLLLYMSQMLPHLLSQDFLSHYFCEKFKEMTLKSVVESQNSYIFVGA